VVFLAMKRRIRIVSTGVALPAEAVTSAELDARLGFAPGTVQCRTGVIRRYVETRRSAADIGAQAARNALDAAGLHLDDIDCLVAASGTPDQPLPYNAALMHEALRFRGRATPAFDVNASCLSFLVALDTLSYLIEARRYRRVLIVSSDIASGGLNWNHLEASGIFGDGAAAAIIEHAQDTGSAILGSSFATFGEGAHYCEIKGGGSRHPASRNDEPFPPLAQFRMDGKAVFRLVAHHLKSFVDDLVSDAGVALADIPTVVPHQASGHGLCYVRRVLGLRDDQMVDIFADYGNQVGASLPFALHTAIASGGLRRGETTLLLGSGAGVSLGGVVLCY
jgi:3-oxoacyl-[acyl-carrier-protein] synthase-3